MGRTTFDWRWIIVILVALAFFGQLRLAPSREIGIVLLALGGYWAIQAGLQPWRERGSLLGSPKVTYWRGQRLDLNPRPTRRSRWQVPPAMPLGISLFYLALGVGFVLAALRSLLLLVTR